MIDTTMNSTREPSAFGRVAIAIYGTLLVAFGLGALLLPMLATLVPTLTIGSLLFTSGTMGLVLQILDRRANGFIWRLLWAVIATLGGLGIFFHSREGPFTLTLVLGGILLAQGLVSLVHAVQHRHSKGCPWGWMAASGVITGILGGLLIWAPPHAGMMIPELFLSASLVSYGFSLIGLGFRRQADSCMMIRTNGVGVRAPADARWWRHLATRSRGEEPGEAILRSLAFDVLWATWTALFGLSIPVLWLARSPPRTIRSLSRAWARGVLTLLAATAGVRYAVRGEHNRPDQPCLIVANHQSPWETVAALVLFPDVAIVAKQELLRVPVMGWFLKHAPMIVIDRGQRSKSLRHMAEASRAALAQGRSVLIFPEGTRMPVGAPVKFKRGVELLYRTLGVAVLPIALDSGRFWRRGPFAKLPGTITVSMLPRIASGMSAAQFSRTAEAAIQAEKAALGG